MASFHNNIMYSEKYYDDNYEYRHVILPRELAKQVPRRLLSEYEWRRLGVQQSRGWVHYSIHQPEPHVLLFRRPITSPPPTQNEPPKKEPISRAVKDSNGLPRPIF
eukprot:gb/GECH01012447.1/.p1 GENE.gb/GECH01012447.1/~~gb/GECH01012447.1/.p1  ORF type:complete len:106 (+),score=27.63 gb/GECH01012447.1/:1-318(+)